MCQLKKFLSLKIDSEATSLDLIVVAGNKGVVLEDQLALHDVCQHFWDGQSDLIVHYRTSVELSLRFGGGM